MSGVSTATVLAGAAIAASVAGTAVTIMGQQQAGAAAKAQGDYQAAVARNNSILANRAAADARQRGQVVEQQQVAKGQQLIGREKAVLASNGVDVNSGSALDITTDTAGQNKLDQLTVRSNAEREALGFEAQGANFDAAAALDKLKGDNASDAADTASFGTALSGAGSVASKWYDFNKVGVGSPDYNAGAGAGAYPGATGGY